MGWDGIVWGGVGWDGMGWDGMGWDGMGWDGVGWDRTQGPQPVCAGLQPRLEGSRLEPAVTKHEADPSLAAHAARHVDRVLALPHAAARRACRVGPRLEQRRHDLGARLMGQG